MWTDEFDETPREDRLLHAWQRVILVSLIALVLAAMFARLVGLDWSGGDWPAAFDGLVPYGQPEMSGFTA